MPTKKPAGSAEWADPDDAPELTEDLLADAEVFEGDRFVRRAGRPRSDATKEQISVRLDADVLARLREAGPGWQSRINELLRTALGLAKAPAAAARTRTRAPETGRRPAATRGGQQP